MSTQHFAAMTSNITVNAANAVNATMNNDGYRDNAIVKFLMDRILLLSLAVLLIGVCVTMATALCVGARGRKKITEEECSSKSDGGGGTVRFDQYEFEDDRNFTTHIASVSGKQIHTNSEYEATPENQSCRPGYDVYENDPLGRNCLSANSSIGSSNWYENSSSVGGDRQYMNLSRAETCNDGIYSIVPQQYGKR
ncbi:uncharacterized protein LOC124253007 isoform X2 [Haliotis rubra]|uniref:uncharacterized protein LOC124253007 isoform X2 n=1 Tax=Haliotis rubra TaxID=36100 RepID=UPI001EE5CE76|nr:uncharacterized protein LOC124253007 isoform X2 [Haliotis rubra]XP_046542677.1 uncharacterized protein LOC124253007 isoform X2 [Haliotis rubra]